MKATRLSRLIHPTAIALVIAAVGLLWHPEVPAQAEPAAMAQSTSQGGVTVKVTPKGTNGDANALEFQVVLDTHSQDLGDDLVQSAVLVVNGSEVKALRWTGAAAGGHHREGVLSFPAPAQPVQGLELRIQRPQESAPRVYRWDGSALPQ